MAGGLCCSHVVLAYFVCVCVGGGGGGGYNNDYNKDTIKIICPGILIMEDI